MPFYLHDQAALDGLIHLETRPSCPPELPNPLLVGQPTLVVTSGVYGVRCFLGSVHADHQLTRPDGHRRNAKAVYNCTLVATLEYPQRQDACVNGFSLLLATATALLYHSFLTKVSKFRTFAVLIGLPDFHP